MGAEARLKERNITLPQPATPLANYVGAVRVGNLMFVSGHGPLRVDGQALRAGKVGRELTVEQGYQVAREVGLALLATIRASVGSLDRIKRVVKVLGMVNSARASATSPRGQRLLRPHGGGLRRRDRQARALRGRHGRAPDGIPVEIEMVLEVE